METGTGDGMGTSESDRSEEIVARTVSVSVLGSVAFGRGVE